MAATDELEAKGLSKEEAMALMGVCDFAEGSVDLKGNYIHDSLASRL